MYTWVKVVLAFIIISILSLVLYLCRGFLPDMKLGNDSDVPALASSSGEENVQNNEVVAVNTTEAIASVTDTAKPEVVAEVKTDAVVPAVVVEEVGTPQPVKIKPALIDDADYDKAANLFARHKYAEARNLLWKTIASRKLDEENPLFWQCAELLDKINTMVITTDLYVPEKIKHNIVSGDSLSKLAKRYKTTVDAIKKSNNIKPESNTVYAGQVLMIYPGFWTIKVIKHSYRLILFDQGRVFKVYNIATGRQNRTPVGTFTIKTKQKNPAWTAPGKNIPFGDPDNVLGTRWMGIEENKSMSQHIGYGIHGTNAPDSIGTSASNGCIRMRNEEVEELYDIVPYGTTVTIVE